MCKSAYGRDETAAGVVMAVSSGKGAEVFGSPGGLAGFVAIRVKRGLYENRIKPEGMEELGAAGNL